MWSSLETGKTSNTLSKGRVKINGWVYPFGAIYFCPDKIHFSQYIF